MLQENNLSSYEVFVNKAIFEISKILDLLDPKIINKIILTSSSSVYGSIDSKINIIDDSNRKIYAAFKISLETLIKNYSNKRGVSLNICRLFNLYGVNDEFSIIEKLRKSKIKNYKIVIYNKGLSVRDFIHVDDVVKIYDNILKKVSGSGLYDIGTGKGLSVVEIIDKLKINKKNLVYKKTSINEINNSIANNKNLIKKLKNLKFKKVENYLSIKESLNYKKISNKNYIENNLIGSVIYGAGYSGKKIVKQMISLDRNNISYFIDDNPKKIGNFVEGIKIISFNDLKNISKKVNIRNIIIAIPSLSLKNRSSLIRKIMPYCDSISTLPEKNFLKNNQINISDINDISFDELFGKKILKTQYPLVQKFKNSRVLITGGAGSIGTEITKQIVKSNPKKVIVLDHSELNIYRISKILENSKIKLILGDIKDKSLVKNILNKYKIDYIFHAAAYKHVKFLEENVVSAVKNNIIGTYNLLEEIKNKSVKFIFISTDKAVNPKNILGVTKRIGEILTQTIFSKNDYKKGKFFILRFGNVIGSDGSALPYFLRLIKKDLPISLTHKNMSRYFMSIKEACNLVIQSSVSKYHNRTLFLDMGKPIKILEIIKKMFKIYAQNDQKLKIEIIGNKFNEKLSEKLFFKNKIYSTSIEKVFTLQNKLSNKKKFLGNLDRLLLNIDDLSENDLKNSLTKLLKIR
jgi:FlaA1/EpsC-like NDP-sugar epimerase